jgi:protein required for attachment to host cells
MNEKLLLLADLGHVKAYRLNLSPARGTPSLQLVDEWHTEATEHLSDGITDQFGRYRKAMNERSDGEEHNLELERRHRAARNIARRIGELTKEVDSWYFAAPSEINRTVLEEMDEGTRAKIEKNVPADLTKVTSDQIIKHFCE